VSLFIYVVEGRRKGRSEKWRPEVCDCGWNALKRMRESLRLYRKNNPRHEWRLSRYDVEGVAK